jgi:hypothetical protein
MRPATRDPADRTLNEAGSNPAPEAMFATPTSNTPRTKPGSSARSARKGCGVSAAVICGGCLAASMMLISRPLMAQEALRTSMAGEAAAEARREQWQSQAYTIKSGDFKLLATPSLGLDYNDNVYLSQSNLEGDFILRPMLQLTATYPITLQNLLSLNVGVGYDYYFDHDDLSGLRLTADSGVSFDATVKDFMINVHDRFSYVRDPATQASIAGTNAAEYVTFNNIAGLLVTGDLNDFIPSIGYDHLNVISGSGQYDYLTHSSEIVIARAGLALYPTLTAGAEGSVNFTTYDQPVLNDNTAYTVGGYANWQPGQYFNGQLRAGYSIYDFHQTSGVIKAEDQNAWYFDVTLSHQPTEALGYALSVGRQLLPGTERTDLTEIFYVRPSVTWSIIQNLKLQTYLDYEHGKQATISVVGNFSENYDWLGAGIGLTHPLLKKLTASLNYRITVRTSNINGRDYTQNLVGLILTYLFQ